MSDLIDAVLYLRMSSNPQEESIPQQRTELTPYAAKHGYRIVREYVDEGISASHDDAKRVQFQQLLLDATKGTFKAVLCWSSSRFSRQDSIDANWAKQILRQNGVFLVTKQEGKIDWNEFMGRMQDFISTEMNHKYSVDLAYNSVRGRQASFDSGKCPFGRIPFGYMRRYWDDKESRIVKRGEKFRKQRGQHSEVLIEETEAEVVRFIFRQFSEKDISLGAMVKLLAGKVSPNGKPWHVSGLRHLLTNPAYCGILEVGAYRFNKKRKGKFAAIVPAKKQGVFPVIVDPIVWQAVQRKIADRKDGQPVPQKERYSPLCGIIYCGNCGDCMARATGRREGKVYHRYKCNSYHRAPGKGCRGWGVSDSELIPRICEVLRKEVDAELLKRIAAKPEAEIINDVTILESQAERLRQKIATGEENYAGEADRKMRDGIGKAVAKWRGELEETEKQARIISAARNEIGLGGLLEWWQTVKNTILAVGDSSLRDGACEVLGKVFDGFPPEEAAELYKRSQEYFLLTEPDMFRAFLHSVGCQVVLWFVEKPGTSKTALWRRAQGVKPRHTYFAVDWERSEITVNFEYDAERGGAVSRMYIHPTHYANPKCVQFSRRLA